MFSRLISYATSGVTDLIAKYAIRASVAVPFLFALAFALAGLTVVLIDHFGYQAAYFMLAGGFAAVGLIAAIVVWLKERNEEREDFSSAFGTVAPIATAALETSKQIPRAIAGGASEATGTFRALADVAVRNWPLVLAAGIVVVLLGGVHVEDRHAFRRRTTI